MDLAINLMRTLEMKSCRGASIQGLKASYLKREQQRLWKHRQKEQELRRLQITRWTGAETEAATVVSHNIVKTKRQDQKRDGVVCTVMRTIIYACDHKCPVGVKRCHRCS